MRVLATALLVVLAAGLAASPAGAYNRKAMSSYEDGLSALEAGRWAEARDAFRRAIELDDDEGRVRVSGVKYADYYPSLGLARALIELDELDGARAALQRFDGISKPGSDQEAEAARLRGRLEAASAPPEPEGPAGDAAAAKAALDRGDLAEARRLARKAPGDALSREVLAAVDELLAQRLTSARRDQEAGALEEARKELQELLRIDPGNGAAQSLLDAVEGDARRARELLGDARGALEGGSLDRAEELAREARSRDLSLADDSRALESEISQARRRAAAQPAPSKPAGGGEKGRALLARARASLDAGQLGQARREAADAAARDSSLSGEVEALRTEIGRRAAQADEALRSARSAATGGRFAEARRLAERAGGLDQGLAAEARSLQARAESEEGEANLLLAKVEAFLESGATASAKSELDSLAAKWPEHPQLAGLRATVEGSGAVVAGLRAFFVGDWEKSIEQLGPLAEGEEVSGRVLAVLGSAKATRGLLLGGPEGEGGEDLAEAKGLFRRALKLEPSLELDERYFSPRVRRVFAEAKGS